MRAGGTGKSLSLPLNYATKPKTALKSSLFKTIIANTESLITTHQAFG